MGKMATIGEYIKFLREAKKYSQRKLSYVAQVSNATIHRMEKNKTIPSPETIKKLSKALGVDYEDLLQKAGYLEKETSGYNSEDKKGNEGCIREIPMDEIINEMKKQRLEHIKDNSLKEWIYDPSSVEYLKFAKKISDLGIDPEFILNEFVSKIFKKNQKKK